MNPSWISPLSYGIQDFSPEALVGGGSTILIPEAMHLRGRCRVDSMTYVSVGLTMEDRSVVCPGAKLIGGKDRKIHMSVGSFIGWNSLVMAKSEDYRFLVGVGFGAPGPAVEGDVIFCPFSGLGSMSSCFPDVHFPDGAVVGMHSMVHKSEDLQPWMIHKGIPARPWKPRDKATTLAQAKEAGWWPQ